MLDARVKGFRLKNSDAHELIVAIDEVKAGKSNFSQKLLVDILDQNRLRNETVKLPLRELGVLKLICDGYCTAEIAEQLLISHRTVDRQSTNLLSKIACKKATSLAIHTAKIKLLKLNK